MKALLLPLSTVEWKEQILDFTVKMSYWNKMSLFCAAE